LIYGIGTDIIEVDRLRKTMEADPGFRESIFTQDEIAYCESKTYKYQHYAARFCAKEAFMKALGKGLRSGILFKDIEVYHDEMERPWIRLTGTAKHAAEDLGVLKILVSLAHLREIANAAVILETKQAQGE
jgi:holo-[acyl-carrier protein] synthase